MGDGATIAVEVGAWARGPWRLKWREKGLTYAVGDDGQRTCFAVRGGIAWPHVVSVGTRSMALGAAVVCGYDTKRGLVEVLASVAFGCVVPRLVDGWPAELGAAGAILDALSSWGCERWYCLDAHDRQVESVRAVRERAGDLGTLLRFTGLEIPESSADGVVWRWTQAGLLKMPDGAVQAIGQELAAHGGAAPHATLWALAAVLSSFDARPWKPDREEPWVPINVRDL